MAGPGDGLRLAGGYGSAPPPARFVSTVPTPNFNGDESFLGVTVGTLAFGHLLAVTTKLLVGSLVGSIAEFYAIGVALAVPSWWLVLHAWRTFASDDARGRATLILNGWLATTLVVLGIQSLPLVVPALCNIGYQLHSRRLVGWAMVSAAVVVNLTLFIVSLFILASGQSFEQFAGMD